MDSIPCTEADLPRIMLHHPFHTMEVEWIAIHHRKFPVAISMPPAEEVTVVAETMAKPARAMEMRVVPMRMMTTTMKTRKWEPLYRRVSRRISSLVFPPRKKCWIAGLARMPNRVNVLPNCELALVPLRKWYPTSAMKKNVICGRNTKPVAAVRMIVRESVPWKRRKRLIVFWPSRKRSAARLRSSFWKLLCQPRSARMRGIDCGVRGSRSWVCQPRGRASSLVFRRVGRCRLSIKRRRVHKRMGDTTCLLHHQEQIFPCLLYLRFLTITVLHQVIHSRLVPLDLQEP
mmetsp:Transcript_5379/g.11417  ORF Transcript_5379/g.11417 Transcript_5379/m.11417 type:complete len:288 (-) Transcript_5379:514-1377(-)